MKRTCLGCKVEKALEEFSRDKTLRTGFRARCKPCLAEARKVYRQENRERYLTVQRAYRKSDKYKEVRRKYERSDNGKASRNKYRSNSPHHIEWRKAYRRTTERKQQRKLYSEQPHIKIRDTIRNRLRSALKGNYKKGMGVDNLGCSISEFQLYLQGLFKEGMSWSNHGEWHIDHIVPLSAFNLLDEEQVKIACHYKNMQPLWWYDNLKKADKYEM